MLFIPERLLKTSHYDFSKTYSQNCPPNFANMLSDAEMMRNMFTGTCDALSEKKDTDVVENFPFDAALEYLNRTPEILDFAVNQANFPLLMEWESAAYPGQISCINDDNEVAATTEIILSRMLAAWGASYSLRGHIHALRTAISNKDKIQALAVTETCKQRTGWSAVRLFKMNYAANILYPGLKGRTGPVETTKEYALASYMLLELNLTSVMIERTLATALLMPNHLQFIINLSMIAVRKLPVVKQAFDTFALPQSDEVRAFCAASEVYYDAMIFGCMLLLNIMMEEGVCDKTKGAEALYVENNILACHLFGLIKKAEDEMIPKMDKHKFVGRDGLQHTLNTMNLHFVAQMQKAKSVYEMVKDNIDGKFDSWNLDTIRNGLVFGADVIGDFVAKDANIQMPEPQI